MATRHSSKTGQLVSGPGVGGARVTGAKVAGAQVQGFRLKPAAQQQRNAVAQAIKAAPKSQRLKVRDSLATKTPYNSGTAARLYQQAKKDLVTLSRYI